MNGKKDFPFKWNAGLKDRIFTLLSKCSDRRLLLNAQHQRQFF